MDYIIINVKVCMRVYVCGRASESVLGTDAGEAFCFSIMCVFICSAILCRLYVYRPKISFDHVSTVHHSNRLLDGYVLVPKCSC